LGALPTMDMALEALAINGGDLQEEGCMEPEAPALHRGAGDLVVHGGGRCEEPPHLLHTEHGGETVGGVRAEECEGVPVALEDRLRAEAHTAGAEAHGRGGEAVDVGAVQAVALQLRFSQAVGGCVGELREEADFSDRGLLGALALATAWQCSNHVLTQWGHEISPFVSGRIVM
jgi:hypothetical protein